MWLSTNGGRKLHDQHVKAWLLHQRMRQRSHKGRYRPAYTNKFISKLTKESTSS